MKNALLLSILFCTLGTAQAQNGVITLLHLGQPTFFYQPASDLNDAIGAAFHGDTIVLPGGEVGPSASVNITKRLTIIGAGIYPTGAPVTNATTMSQAGNVNYNLYLTATGSGSSFEGIGFTRGIYFNSNVSNITFSRCNIGPIGYANVNQSSPTDLVISQSVLHSGMTFHSGIGLAMSNCILGGNLYFGTSPSNAYINQCIFLNANNSGVGYNPGVMYTNCAFLNSSTNGMAINHASTYDHCWFAPTNGFPLVTFGTQPVHIGDKIAAFSASYFINANATDFAYDKDYTPVPSPTNPMLGNGVDGQNIGLYGPGTTGWKDLAIPSNPHWTQFTPNGNINTTGGTIQVHIKAEAQQN
ncbi:MAG: hypothetical protein KF843_13240 [Flavobacteriales bacterium]|nr:hypothetical protein [Flavobacteriales bacterium]